MTKSSSGARADWSACSAASISSADIARSASALMFSASASSSSVIPSASAQLSAGEIVALGSADGSPEGSAEGALEGSAEGVLVGSAEGSIEGSAVTSAVGLSEGSAAGASGSGVVLSVTASEDAAISVISALPASTSSAIAGMPVNSIAMQVAAARMRSHLCFMFTPPVSIIIQITSLIITFINELYKRAPGDYSKRALEVHLIWVDSV